MHVLFLKVRLLLCIPRLTKQRYLSDPPGFCLTISMLLWNTYTRVVLMYELMDNGHINLFIVGSNPTKTALRRFMITYVMGCIFSIFKPGFHLQQTPRPRQKKQSDYLVEQSSFPLIALIWLKIGRCHGRNRLYELDDRKKLRSIVHLLSSGKVEMYLCAACHAFTPHVNALEN